MNFKTHVAILTEIAGGITQKSVLVDPLKSAVPFAYPASLLYLNISSPLEEPLKITGLRHDDGSAVDWSVQLPGIHRPPVDGHQTGPLGYEFGEETDRRKAFLVLATKCAMLDRMFISAKRIS